MDDNIIRVAILASTLAVRVGLRTLLGEHETLDVVAEAASFAGLEVNLADVDLILLQGRVPLEDWDLPSDLKSHHALLWVTEDPQAVVSLRRTACRAWGIVSPEANQAELIAAVLAVDLGYIVAPGPVLETFWVEPYSPDAGPLIETLTPREIEVLQLLAHGLANKQIALELEISEHTVKFHISSIYRKLGTTNRTAAVRLGLQAGIIIL